MWKTTRKDLSSCLTSSTWKKEESEINFTAGSESFNVFNSFQLTFIEEADHESTVEI